MESSKSEQNHFNKTCPLFVSLFHFIDSYSEKLFQQSGTAVSEIFQK